MIGRAAALLILASQAILLWTVFDFSGLTATVFSFFGHTSLALGVFLALVALARRPRGSLATSEKGSR